MPTKTFLLLIVLAVFFSNAKAQNNSIQIEYKKGEVLDIILNTTQSDSEEAYNRYRKTAIPIAFEYSFQLMPVFDIVEAKLGLSVPSNFILGKWDSIKKREDFLKNIVSRLPDFHEQRKNLFTDFVLTYYELEKDVSFHVNKEKYNVATSFWKDDEKSYTTFVHDWKDKVEELGGKIILELSNGNSPTGYYYNPDSFILVEWETEWAFTEFLKANPLSTYEVLQNVHQFSIE